MKRYCTIAIVVTLAGLLAACGGNDDKPLGFDKSPPDEFRIITKPALTIPPEFNLRPPLPGTRANHTASSAEIAYFVLTGKPMQETAPSQGEQIILDKAGANARNAGIRLELDNEARNMVSKDPFLVNQIAVERQDTQ